MEDRWIQTKVLYNLLDLEPFLLISLLLLSAWGFYKFFLVEASQERHENIRRQFRSLVRHYIGLCVSFALFHLLKMEVMPIEIQRVVPYIAILTFVWGGVVFVRTSRLIILQYLFLGSMRAGVPLLIVNIFSLALSLLLILWGASQVFNIRLGPLLATSAAFSIILGMALQDTLGNLFAGISLQLDRVFEIGDWLEIETSSQQKAVGQVKEITWRATTLIGWTEETIIIPNRVMASSQICNFLNGEKAFIRSQIFRIPYGADLEKVESVLLKSLENCGDLIRKFPSPLCFVWETTESWIALKLVYYIDAYGNQFIIGDRVVIEGWKALEKAGYPVSARRVIHLEDPDGISSMGPRGSADSRANSGDGAGAGAGAG